MGIYTRFLETLRNIEASHKLHTFTKLTQKFLFYIFSHSKIFFQLFYPCTHVSTKEKFNIQVLEPLLRHVTDINDINKKPNQHFFTQYTVHDSLSYTSIDST